MAPARQRSTRQGGAVKDALTSAGGFCSAQDVYAALRSQGDAVGLSTVYRHLQSLVDAGLVDVIHTPEGETTYRLCGEANQGHHHHLVCRECGRTAEIEGRSVEKWAATVAAEHGYTEVDHTLELFGRCAECSATR
ncbi:MAG TPA: Fur family transcriptional regulator [Jatrophihabitantaceae bacterium]|jgi:Fur family ferric uptake transcriptional regulator|nr:Fur family transcriptional regulator [Jatrophihabitantaceae bacterium]